MPEAHCLVAVEDLNRDLNDRSPAHQRSCRCPWYIDKISYSLWFPCVLLSSQRLDTPLNNTRDFHCQRVRPPLLTAVRLPLLAAVGLSLPTTRTSVAPAEAYCLPPLWPFRTTPSLSDGPVRGPPLLTAVRFPFPTTVGLLSHPRSLLPTDRCGAPIRTTLSPSETHVTVTVTVALAQSRLMT